MTSSIEGPPLLSVVIPTRNRSEVLALAVRSVWEQTLGADRLEVIVVDNCSEDDTPERVRALQQEASGRLLYHRMPSNLGPAASRNAGAHLSTAALVAFLDSDVRLDPEWCRLALEAVRAAPSIGLIGGKLVYGTQPEILNAFGGGMSRLGFGWDADDGASSRAFDQPRDCLWIPSAALLVRREVLERLGGFDDSYYISYEDADLGWRANLLGFRVVCLPTLVAHHFPAESHDDSMARMGSAMTFHSQKNRLRSMLKNRSGARLLGYLPSYAAYSCADILARPPRLAKLKAWWWNLRWLADTLERRAMVQRQRVVEDRQIDHLFTSNLFPEQTLRARREQSLASRLAARVL